MVLPLAIAAAWMLSSTVSQADPVARVIGNLDLKPGDILYADSGNAVEGGGVFKTDPLTGLTTPIAMGGHLRMPFGLTVDWKSGLVFVSDSGRLLVLDPVTGDQVVIADQSLVDLGWPCGMELDEHGNVVFANLQAILQFEVESGQLHKLAEGGYLLYPIGVTVARNGNLYVANMAFPANVICVHAGTGDQSVVSEGGFLRYPQAIALDGKDIYVADMATPNGNFGVGRVVHVDARTGEQTVVAEGGYLVGPVGITVDDSGWLIVGDPYTINPESPNLYDGGIIRIDPVTGEQTLLARGQGGFINPRGVAIVPRLLPVGVKQMRTCNP